MAQHAIQQMNNASASRFVLIVGAGHVISLKNAIQSLRPDIVVKELNEL